jgi:tRNA threonylcarbamoyladenosine biosynthesis protein TsaE
MNAATDAIMSMSLPHAEDTAALGAQLAHVARPGDVIGLAGELGSGKTTLARGFIQALTGPECDVPSPTFTLVQTYDTPRGTVWHFDLYRLERADEAVELGLEEALTDGICLIEWPQLLGGRWPRHALWVDLGFENGGRTACLRGPAAWRARVATIAEPRTA